MFNRTLTLFVALLFIGAGLFTTNAQAQTDARHDVTVEIEEFTFIGPPGDEGGPQIGNLGDLKVKFDGGQSSPAEIVTNPGVDLSNNTRDINSGTMSATAGSFELQYGTNSTDDEKITVTTEDGESWNATNGSITVKSTNVSINPASNVLGFQGQSVGTVTLDGSSQDFVTGINQGGGTVSFDYGFEVGLYTEAQSVTQTVTYTLTAN